IGQDLVPGDVITIEPGLYRSGYGGLRLEDIVLVTDDGYEVITQYPYELTPWRTPSRPSSSRSGATRPIPSSRVKRMLSRRSTSVTGRTSGRARAATALPGSSRSRRSTSGSPRPRRGT